MWCGVVWCGVARAWCGGYGWRAGRQHSNICSSVQFRPGKPWEVITGGLDGHAFCCRTLAWLKVATVGTQVCVCVCVACATRDAAAVKSTRRAARADFTHKPCMPCRCIVHWDFSRARCLNKIDLRAATMPENVEEIDIGKQMCNPPLVF